MSESKGSGGVAPARGPVQGGLPERVVETLQQIVAVEAEARQLVAAETERAEALVIAARGEARALVASARERVQSEVADLLSEARSAAERERAARLDAERAALGRLDVTGVARSRAVALVVRCVLGVDRDGGAP